jgi:hypothetical protein
MDNYLNPSMGDRYVPTREYASSQSSRRPSVMPALRSHAPSYAPTYDAPSRSSRRPSVAAVPSYAPSQSTRRPSVAPSYAPSQNGRSRAPSVSGLRALTEYSRAPIRRPSVAGSAHGDLRSVAPGESMYGPSGTQVTAIRDPEHAGPRAMVLRAPSVSGRSSASRRPSVAGYGASEVGGYSRALAPIGPEISRAPTTSRQPTGSQAVGLASGFPSMADMGAVINNLPPGTSVHIRQTREIRITSGGSSDRSRYPPPPSQPQPDLLASRAKILRDYSQFRRGSFGSDSSDDDTTVKYSSRSRY